jgi:hypothetical protein
MLRAQVERWTGSAAPGQGSRFEQINGSPGVLINAFAFDEEGNAYVADTALGAEQFDPPFEARLACG